MRLTIHQKAGYLRDAVFAANDGVVTTFAVIAGSAGASLGPSVVLILGFANLFADGFSMAAGNYLGVKSEMEFEESKGEDGHKEGSPLKQGVVSFVAFNLAGFIPVIPFLFKLDSAFQVSIIFVGLSFLAIGFLKSIYTRKNIFVSGAEVFLVGSFAAFIAFAIGFLVERFVV